MFKIDEAIENQINLFSLNPETDRMEFQYKDDILQEYEELFKRVLPTINTNPATGIGQIITTLTQGDLGVISYMENYLNSFFFGGSGQFLDNWAWNLFRVKRKEGIPSSAIVKITGVPLTQVPSNFTITDGVEEFRIDGATTILPNGEVEARFTNININTNVVGAGTLNQFITLVNGIETVTNPNQSTQATLKESDTDLFIRCFEFGATATNSELRSILANVGAVNGVTKWGGIENRTKDTVVKRGVTMTPHSISICAVGASDEDVARAIMTSRATGCDMIGNTDVTFRIDESDYVYTFYRPTIINLKAKVQVLTNIDSPTNWETIIRDTLVNYINGLNVGVLISQPQLSKTLNNVSKGFDVIDVQFSEISEALGYAPLQLNLNEVALISSVDIEVIQ